MIFWVREKFCPYNRKGRNGLKCCSFFIFMKESDFQKKLIGQLEKRFPGSIIMKNDPTYIQGIPDLTMLYKNSFVAFECKRSANASKQPNQEWYVNEINKMGGIAYFIYPENMEETINDISRKLGIE